VPELRFVRPGRRHPHPAHVVVVVSRTPRPARSRRDHRPTTHPAALAVLLSACSSPTTVPVDKNGCEYRPRASSSGSTGLMRVRSTTPCSERSAGPVGRICVHFGSVPLGEPRYERLHVSLLATDDGLIWAAARAANRPLTELVLRAARASAPEATDTLAERDHVVLDPETRDRFDARVPRRGEPGSETQRWQLCSPSRLRRRIDLPQDCRASRRRSATR